MHYTFMHEHIPNTKFMVLAETSTFGIFRGRNVLGRIVQAETSVAEMSEHPQSGVPVSHIPLTILKNIPYP